MNNAPLESTKHIRTVIFIRLSPIDKLMGHYKEIDKCRICNSESLTEVIKISAQYLSPTFVESNEENELSKIKVPLTVVLCDKNKNPDSCGLVQLKETVDPGLLYTNYFYRTSVNDTMKRDLQGLVTDLQQRVKLVDKDVVVDIGANDCTMLTYFPESTIRIGVEPAKNINWSNLDKSIKVVNDYFSKTALTPALNSKKVKAFTSCAMFYDLDDPGSFVKDIKSLLAPDGVWCIQLSYIVLMLKNLNFYDICHEHLEYYSLRTLSALMEKHGLKIFDASTNEVNGGSLRVFITHKENNLPVSENMEKLLQTEDEMRLYDVKTYTDFYEKIESLGKKVRRHIVEEINKGNPVLGLGASTKGNVLLQFFGIDKNILPYISEKNPMKVGLKTLGSDITLISEEHARNLKPSLMLVLPWYFKKEIVEREQEYIQNGGKLLFPMPYPHLVTSKEELNL